MNLLYINESGCLRCSLLSFFIDVLLCSIHIMRDNTLDLYLLQEPHHEPHVRAFLEYHESEYQGVKLIGPEEDIDPVTSRNIGL